MINNLEILGIKPEGTHIDKGVNPTQQSLLVKNGKSVVVARPFQEQWSGLQMQQELKKRVRATQLHQQILPRHTLDNHHVVLQGKDGDDLVPVLGRFSEKLEDVRPITELPSKEILFDHELCSDLAAISLGYLKLAITQGKMVDCGFNGNMGANLPKPISRFTRRLTGANTMIGFDQHGDRRVFCDPDWFNQADLSRGGIKQVAKFSACQAARFVFFGTASVVAKAQERPTVQKIFQRRMRKKRATSLT